jgi:hypothetical protein
MPSNNLHNLMTQLVQEQKSLWRIENNYIAEAESAEERAFWEEMSISKKAQIEELKNLLKENM